MNTFKKYTFLFLISFSLIFVTSCGKDETEDDPITSFGDGIFVVNTESEVSEKSSVSYYDRTRDEVANDIYLKKNSVPIPKELYSMSVFDGKGYLILAGVGKIIVVDPISMEMLATIDGFDIPHHFLPIGNNKAYVSDWGNDGVTGSVKIVDLVGNSIIGTIPTRRGPEHLLKQGNNVYISMTGGFFVDSVVTVINTATDQIVKNIDVELVPSSMQLDKNGDIWVLCRGLIDFQNPNNSRQGELIKLVDDEIELSITVASAASDLVINNSKDVLYFLNPIASSWTWEHPIASTTLATVPFIDIPVNHLGYDPETNLLIGADIGNTQQNGELVLFDSNGKEETRFEVGILPTNFWARSF